MNDEGHRKIYWNYPGQGMKETSFACFKGKKEMIGYKSIHGGESLIWII